METSEKMKKNVTLKDIARIAGCSVNSVSHALHDKPDISAATRENIKKIAAELGYVGNDSARSMRLGVSGTIAVILGDIANPHFSIIVREIEQIVRKYGYTIFVLNTNEDPKAEAAAIQTAARKNADGIIICPVQKNRENTELLKSTRIPYVLIGRRFKNSDESFVVCDDFNGGYLATQHLISLGHKNILFLNGPKYISSSKERLDGYKKAYSEAGLKYNGGLVIHNPPQTGNSRRSLIKTLIPENKITAILSFNDMIAWEVIAELNKMGLRVPEDISVAGFDNIQSKFNFPVMLTTVSSLKTTMAATAAEMLIKNIKGEPVINNQVTLGTKLIARETTRKI